MVIQRWQSLLLFLAVVAMAVFCFTPFLQFTMPAGADGMLAECSFSPVFPIDMPVFFIINVLAAVLLFIAIFLFRDLKRQMFVTVVAFVLELVSLAMGVAYPFIVADGPEYSFTGGLLLVLAAMIFTITAHRFMKKDRDLLRSYERMR